MPTIEIKNVPEGAEEGVKEMAMVAIERYLRKNVKPSKEVIDAFQEEVDDARKANGLNAKFETEEVEK